jgi:membrane protein DedA with SNARE-associated domain
MNFLVPYAYEPWMVYGIVILLLTASSFGLPMPEEVTLVSAGVIAYIGLNPDKYPPPSPDSTPVDPWMLSFVCFFAVFLSDYLVFSIGRYVRTHAERFALIDRFVPATVMEKVTQKTKKYGALMAGFFRFTPALRFPGHFACGFLGVAPWKFTAVDGTAALLSVPTQVLLLSFYGEEILGMIKQFKITLLVIFSIIITAYIARKIYIRRQIKKQALNRAV